MTEKSLWQPFAGEPEQVMGEVPLKACLVFICSNLLESKKYNPLFGFDWHCIVSQVPILFKFFDARVVL